MHALAQILALVGNNPVGDTQSPLHPAGWQADHIAGLYWLTFYITASVWAIVVAVALIGALRNRMRLASNEIIHPEPASEKKVIFSVSTAVVITVVILFVLLVDDFIVGDRNRALGYQDNPLTIKVTAHQWWWEVTYMNPDPSQTVNDANEIHVPIGRTIALELHSGDVIHSFWVPNMAGKKDMIPGHTTTHFIKAERIGTFWGQCAEYCGHQHAHMRLAFVVQKPEEFQSWYQSALQSAHPPQTASQKRGMLVFMAGSCSMCHTISGTPAGSKLGPDLTHVASRMTLAAGSVPNTMGHLGGWVTDPQGIKPGVIMPQNSLTPDDLQSLLDYLENLK